MCSKIDRKEKFQESEFLPSEWWYCFEEKHTNPEYDGLVIAKSTLVLTVRCDVRQYNSKAFRMPRHFIDPWD